MSPDRLGGHLVKLAKGREHPPFWNREIVVWAIDPAKVARDLGSGTIEPIREEVLE